MIRHLRRAAWVLVVLVLLGVLVWTGANLVGSWRYQSAVAALEAEGFATHSAGIEPPPVVVAENASPYYSAAFALAVPAPADSPWLDSPRKTVAELNPGHRAAAEAWLKQNGEAFDLVRRAQERPRCRFARDYSQGYSMLMPELSGVISLSRALGTLAESQLLAGDDVAARKSVKLIFALGDCLRDEPILISQLVRLSAVETALAVVEGAVTDATGEADLRDWLALLPPDSFFHGGLERAYRGEIAMAAVMLNKPLPETLALLQGMKGRTSLVWELMRPLVRYDGADYLYDMRRMVLACRKPYVEAAAEIASSIPKRHSAWSPVRSLLLPALDASVKRQATIDARLIVVRAGLEAEKVRKATGAYPKAVPGTDPFSGKSLIYDLEKGRIASVRPAYGDGDPPLEWRLRATK